MSDSFFLQVSVDYSRGLHRCEGRAGLGRHERELSLSDCESGVVGGVSLVVTAVVGDPAHDFVGIVAAGKSSLGVGPIRFGLAAMAGRHSSRRALTFRQ